jgi:hypothetical protein
VAVPEKEWSMSTKNSSGFGVAGDPVRRRWIEPVFGALACALAAFAIAVPVALAADGTDLRSPDTADAAATQGGSAMATDLRSPDTRSAAADLRRTQVVGGFQSPDRQDANRPSVQIVQLPAVETVRTIEVSSGMSAWAGAGIGASVLLAVMLALAGVLVAMRWRLARTVPTA